MTKDEALKLTLESLEELVGFVPFLQPTCAGDERAIGHRLDRAITAITIAKETLAQSAHTGWPEGLLQDDDRKLSKWLASKPDAKHVVDMAQPALCKYGNEVQGCTSSPMDCQCCFDSLDDLDEELAQEPVLLNGLTEDETNATASVMGLTARKQRPWVGLTDEQFIEAARLAEAGNYLVAFQRIQQALKEKNT